VRAPSAILVDLSTGRVLFAKHPHQRRPIASLTKMMTALLVLEHADLADVVTVSRKAAATDPIVLGLQPGERITVKSLLWGLLLRSGNDAAVALAEHVSGSVTGFLRLMNARARELGLGDTFFASSNGLDDDGFSTVQDLEILAREALRDRFFAAVVRSRFHRIPGPPGQIRRLWNLNEMLIRYPGSIGVKTGYTRGAGNCLVAAAVRDGRVLVAVVLGDPPGTHWRFAYGDAGALLDYGFAMEAFSPLARAMRAA
jgi:D-alanyl-D-alanine carboxypeptidase